MERALRGWARHDSTLPSMTEKQRQACLEEIRAVEGYELTAYITSSDADLARGTLSAWRDWCRDKGFMI